MPVINPTEPELTEWDQAGYFDPTPSPDDGSAPPRFPPVNPTPLPPRSNPVGSENAPYQDDAPPKVWLEKRVLCFPRAAIPQADYKFIASHFTADSVEKRDSFSVDNGFSAHPYFNYGDAVGKPGLSPAQYGWYSTTDPFVLPTVKDTEAAPLLMTRGSLVSVANFRSDGKIEFQDSAGEGTGSTYFLMPRPCPLNFATAPRHGQPRGHAGCFTLQWKGDDFETVGQVAYPHTSGLTNAYGVAGRAITATTKERMGANRGFYLQVTIGGSMARSPSPSDPVVAGEGTRRHNPVGAGKSGLRITWGGDYSLALHVGTPPKIEKRKNGGGGGKRQLVRELEGGPLLQDVPSDSPMEWMVFLVGSRGVIMFRQGQGAWKGWHFANSEPDSKGELQARPVRWNKASLSVSSYGLGLTFYGGALAYCPELLTPQEHADMAREFKPPFKTEVTKPYRAFLSRQRAGSGDSGPALFRGDLRLRMNNTDPLPDGAQWILDKAGDFVDTGFASVTSSVTSTPQSDGTVELALDLRLLPHPEKALIKGWKGNGRRSGTLELGTNPFTQSTHPCASVSKLCVWAKYPAPPTESAMPVDISSAVLRAGGSSAMPPTMQGLSFDLELDPHILELMGADMVAAPDEEEFFEEMFRGSTVPSSGLPLDLTGELRPYAYVRPFNPITVEVRWQYIGNDGTIKYVEDGKWFKMFHGYISQITRTSGMGNARTLNLACRDALMRLSDTSAPIDHRYLPLDILWMQKRDEVPQYYGSHAIQDILSIALGTRFAAKINGDGNPFRYTPSNHPPLISETDIGNYFTAMAAASVIPAEDTWRLPAPWRETALDWINTIAGHDSFLFLMGWNPFDGPYSWPYPIYGRMEQFYVKAEDSFILPDNAYYASDINALVASVETATRPDADINRVWVGGNIGGDSEIEKIRPASRMAVRRFGPDHPNAPEKTWERTSVQMNTLYAYGDPDQRLAEQLADLSLELNDRISSQFPSFKMRFEPGLRWGQVVQARASSWKGESIAGQPTAEGFSDVVTMLSGKKFRIVKVDHALDWVEGKFNTGIFLSPLSFLELKK